MADKKISQLTGATTPLAGTEVLPIVQSGSTVKVSVDNLTAGKAVSASSLTLSTPLSVANGGTGTSTTFTSGSVVFAGGSGVYNQNNSRLFWDNTDLRLGIGTATPSEKLDIVSPAGTASIRLHTDSVGSVVWRIASQLLGVANGGFVIRDDTAGANRLSIDTSGNVGVVGGNLVVGTAGKGIDFSATSGTGTSELLDDYEEGEFTATLKGSTTDPTTPVTTSGKYTKIGDQVTIYVSFAGVDTTGAAGNVSVTGLPFTVGGGRSMGNVYVGLMTIANKYITSYLTNSGTAIDFLDVESGGYGGNLQHSAGAGRYLEFSLTYKAA